MITLNPPLTAGELSLLGIINTPTIANALERLGGMIPFDRQGRAVQLG